MADRAAAPGRLLTRAAGAGVVSAALLVIALTASGRISIGRSVMLFAAVGALLAAAVAPRWFVLVLLAVPPGLRTLVPALRPAVLAALCLAAVAVHALRGQRLRLGRPEVVVGGLLLVALGLVHRFTATAISAAAVTDFWWNLVYYTALFVLAATLSGNDGRFRNQALIALLVGVLGSEMIYSAQVAMDPSVVGHASTPIRPGLLFHRTHYGYMTALGFVAALALATYRPSRAARLGVAVTGAFLLLAFTRGAWGAALVAVVLIPWVAGRRRRALVAPFLVAVLFLVPATAARLSSDIQGGLSAAVASGAIGSNRLLLWRQLLSNAEPVGLFGRGLGYVWSLTPEQIAGVPDTFTEGGNPLVYAHNDFLHLWIDLGAVGVAWLAVAFLAAAWTAVALGRARVTGNDRGVLFLLVGVTSTFLFASLFDNGLVIQPVAERFFAVAGLAAGALIARKEAARASFPIAPPRRTPAPVP